MLSCNWRAGGLHRPNKLASTCSPLREYLECRGERYIDRMHTFGREDARRARHWRRHRWHQHCERPVIQFFDDRCLDPSFSKTAAVTGGHVLAPGICNRSIQSRVWRLLSLSKSPTHSRFGSEAGRSGSGAEAVIRPSGLGRRWSRCPTGSKAGAVASNVWYPTALRRAAGIADVGGTRR